MNIRLGERWMSALKVIGDTMRVPGKKRPSATKIIKTLIEEAERDATPRDYQTTGFERE